MTCDPLMVTRERLEGTGESDQGAQAHSQQGRSRQESALGLPSSAAVQGVPAERAPGFPVAPQSHTEEASVGGDSSPSGKENLKTLASDSQPRGAGTGAPVHTECSSNLQGSTGALEGSSPHGSLLTVPDSNSEPWIPATPGGERSPRAAVSTAEMQNVLAYQDTPNPWPEKRWILLWGLAKWRELLRQQKVTPHQAQLRRGHVCLVTSLKQVLQGCFPLWQVTQHCLGAVRTQDVPTGLRQWKAQPPFKGTTSPDTSRTRNNWALSSLLL